MAIFAVHFFVASVALAESQTAAVTEKLKNDFPNMHFSEINATPIAGIFEVVAGDNILYFAAETEHLIFGEIFTKEGKNLTAATREKVASAKISQVPLELAVKIGDGKNVVIEFTDPDCPFCRKSFDFFEQQKNVTRYVFFNPLEIHPNAEKKARYILSAQDPVVAYKAVMSGAFDKVALPDFVDSNKLADHTKVSAMLGIHGTPNFWINGVHVGGADFQAISKLLN